jgi:site-specific DNA-methyltransferase (adenine-specific)
LKATGAKYAYAFQSEQEATNCLHYLQTKFARAGLAIFKYNLHIYPAQLSTTPWVDFKQSWTDAQLFKHFGLSEEEKQFVRSMSDIYPNYSEE